MSGRGIDGATYEREFTPAGATGQWTARGDGLSTWSERALGDTWPGVPRLAVGTASDRSAIVQRGPAAVATTAVWSSAGDIVSRPDGSFLMAGRALDGRILVTDGGPPCSATARSAGSCAEATAIHVVDLTSAIRAASVRMDAGRGLASVVDLRPPDGLRRPPHGPRRP